MENAEISKQNTIFHRNPDEQKLTQKIIGTFRLATSLLYIYSRTIAAQHFFAMGNCSDLPARTGG